MSKLKCFAIAGMKLWFWSDDHNPPHFHAKRNGEWEIRVLFLRDEANMIEEKWTKTKKSTISRRDRDQIANKVLTHREDILREWEAHHP
jgi:Domain of unknown function (DUF4160)